MDASHDDGVAREERVRDLDELWVQLSIEEMQAQRRHYEREAWREYAAAALANGAGPAGASSTADIMLAAEKDRFGALPK